MTFQQIIKSIDEKKLSPVYFLHGKEAFYIDELVRHFEEHVLDEAEKAFNQSILYGKDVDDKNVLDHVRQFPVMAQKRLVILKEAAEMKSLENLKGYVEAPNPDAVLVIVYRNKKVDKRKAFFKSLSKHAAVFESKPLKDKDLPAWIKKYVQRSGVQIEPVAVDMLIELIGANLGNLSNELDKMMIGMKRGSKIMKNQVLDEIGMSKEYNIFELQSAIAAGDYFRVHRITHHFAEHIKEYPLVMLIAVLYNFYSKLYIAAAHPNVPDQKLAQLLGYSSAWFIRDYKMAAHRYAYEDVEQCLEILHRYDLMAKGLGARNPDQGGLMMELVDQLIYVRQIARN